MRLTSICAVLVLAVGVASAQHKGTPKAPAKSGDTKATFEAMYKQGEKLFDAKNVAGIQMGLAPGFTETSMGKTMNAAQSSAGLKQFLAMFKSVQCSFKMKTCKINGNMATTTDSARLWGPTAKPDPKTHKPGKLEASRDETMTWTKIKGHWMIKSIVASNDKMMLNGKPYMPPMGK